MQGEETTEKLALDIEARRERDQWELAAWHNKEIHRINLEEQSTVDRLGVDNTGVSRDYANRREGIKNQYEKKQQESEDNYYNFQNKLADGDLYHVWIDANEEEKFKQAKKIWDGEVSHRMDHYGKAISEKEIDRFEKEYGFDIVQQLIRSTARDLQRQEQEEITRQTEKEERIKKHDIEQTQKAEQDRIEEKIHEARKNGLSMTFDADSTPHRLKNPLDKSSAHYIRLLEESKRRQAQEKEHEEKRVQANMRKEIIRNLMIQHRENQQTLDGGMSCP